MVSLARSLSTLKFFGWAMMLALLTLPVGSALAVDGPLMVGRMKVTLMPEYDSTAVLVIQEGKFADRNAFPRAVGFALPKEVTKLTDVCSLSPGGHHFCQLFKIDYGENRNYLNIKLPYSDFFIDYQYAPFTATENSERRFSFPLDTTNPAKTIEVHVQKPYRSERFAITPAADEVYEKDGFEFHKVVFRDVKAGSDMEIKISYFKPDARPSVDMMFTAMASPSLFGENAGELLLGAGCIGLGTLWYLRRRRRAGSTGGTA